MKINIKEFLAFEDWCKYVENDFRKERWITVYSGYLGDTNQTFIYCSMIPNERIYDVLNNVSWDISIGDGRPYYTDHNGKGKGSYFRFGNDSNIEPLVFYRDFFGIEETYLEISEEFRLYHNLYHNYKNNKYLFIDENGDEDEVIIVKENEIRIKLEYLREFLYVKNMHLALYFDLIRFSNYTLKELNLKESSNIIKKNNYVYSITISKYDSPLFNESKRVISRLYGKKIIEGIEDFSSKSSYSKENKEYVDFIIGMDNNCKEITYSCNPKKLADFFGKNSDGPNYLTPVFFKREVLAKYYSNPKKYSVEDNYLRCKGLWGLRMDNNHEKFVVVYLGDLGNNLYTKEQLYWRSFNIIPEGFISPVTFRRDFLAQGTDPSKSDLLFKYRFENFQKEYFKKNNWYLFKPLLKEDEHYFISLRIPLIDDQSEFDQQVLALTKILIDSLNEDEIGKSIGKSTDEMKGITKFEEFLKSHGLQDYYSHIEFLRSLQELRSSGVGHRKGRKYYKIASYFGIDGDNYKSVFEDILNESIILLDYLGLHFLK